MRFPRDAYWMVFLATSAVTWISVPLWRRWCVRNGLVDEPGGRKDHGSVIPLAGGLAVLTGLAFVVLMGWLAIQFDVLEGTGRQLLAHGMGRRVVPLGAVLLGALGMLLLGVLDDSRELPAGIKFGGQLLIALLVATAGVRATLFVPSLVFSYAVTVLWILTITNAVNFLDNMNGLCAGLGLIAAAWFATTAIRHGQYLVALLALSIAGALAGFLPHNFPRARVFLGDGGSHLTGFLLAVLALLPNFYSMAHPVRWAVLEPLVVLLVPLMDLSQVVCTRIRAGKPVWIGDHNHLSHRLVRLGLNRTQAVAVLWLVAVGAGIITLW